MLIPGLYATEQISCTDTSCQVLVCCNPAHPLYAGHFPGQPVTPGVCLMQIAVELIEHATGQSLRLRGARQVKFLRMHHPAHPLRFALSWAADFDRLDGRITVFQNDTCIAKINAQFERS